MTPTTISVGTMLPMRSRRGEVGQDFSDTPGVITFSIVGLIVLVPAAAPNVSCA